MERAARVMQEDMPLTFQDMQRTSKEFEILGKQLNYLTGVVVSVGWCGAKAAGEGFKWHRARKGQVACEPAWLGCPPKHR